MSDHGAKPMDGGICINEWLSAKGYLTLAEQPERADAVLARDGRLDAGRRRGARAATTAASS